MGRDRELRVGGFPYLSRARVINLNVVHIDTHSGNDKVSASDAA